MEVVVDVLTIRQKHGTPQQPRAVHPYKQSSPLTAQEAFLNRDATKTSLHGANGNFKKVIKEASQLC